MQTRTSLLGKKLFKSTHRPLTETKVALPVETPFEFPSPITALPPAKTAFGLGAIDLGGLVVSPIKTFNRVWSTHEGGPDNLGASFFEPTNLLPDFSCLGYYAQPNNRQLFGWVLTGVDICGTSLRPPTGYVLLGSTESLKIKQDGPGYFWQPIPPSGYQAIGLVVTTTNEKPPLNKISCVRSDLTEQCEADTWVWGIKQTNVSSLRPINRGTQSTGVYTGTFGGEFQNFLPSDIPLCCLKNTKLDFFLMPTLPQIEFLFQTYSPLIYFHPEEEFLPSSVDWYFANGALLYKRGEESKPIPIQPNGSNLPQGGSDDGAFWLNIPVDKNERERVKRGDLANTKVYLQVKPMFGGTFTDITIWVFYPFSGSARLKLKFIKHISLGKIGEHTGDWEHVTLRISNLNADLWRVFLSQHSGGVSVDACDLEYQVGGGRKPVLYASLHGHAMFQRPGLVLQGGGGFRLRNDTARSDKFIDTGKGYEVIAAEGIVEPPWVNYFRKWGPRIDYDFDKAPNGFAKILPSFLRKSFRKLIGKIPREALEEDGPTGPKVKGSWAGDE